MRGRTPSASRPLAAIAAVLALSSLAAAAPSGVLEGRVVGVIDGDTITVLTPALARVTVRLAEIDAPESGQPWGGRSKQALSELVFSRQVRVTGRERERYGRLLGRVSVNGQDVNARMVRSGSAWAYRQYLKDQDLVAAEADARRARRGLWSLPPEQTVAPWEWRDGRRRGTITIVPAVRRATGEAASCGSKRYCREMSSCGEARQYLRRCGLTKLDADSDGTPCEALCAAP